jgi:hypothetical protein
MEVLSFMKISPGPRIYRRNALYTPCITQAVTRSLRITLKGKKTSLLIKAKGSPEHLLHALATAYSMDTSVINLLSWELEGILCIYFARQLFA